MPLSPAELSGAGEAFAGSEPLGGGGMSPGVDIPGQGMGMGMGGQTQAMDLSGGNGQPTVAGPKPFM